MGLMRIMPQTGTDLRARYGRAADPHDNIEAGAAYVRELHDRYGSPGFLAAYNASALRRSSGDRSTADETQAYVAMLVPMIKGEPSNGQIIAVVKSFTWAGSPLFAVRIASNSTVDRPPHGVHPDRPLGDRAVVDLSVLLPQSDNVSVHPPSEARSR